MLAGRAKVKKAVMMAAGSIFPAPTDAALAATVLAVVIEVFRRLRHGDDPSSIWPPMRSKSSLASSTAVTRARWRATPR